MVKSLRYAVTLKAAPLDVDMEASGTMLVENKNPNETSTIVLGSIYPFPFLAKPTLSTRLHTTQSPGLQGLLASPGGRYDKGHPSAETSIRKGSPGA